MADDIQYTLRSDAKRKFDDPATPAATLSRRPTGFSAPIASPPPAAVPADEIELAKQKAQEIAARIFSTAEAKRPKLENGAAADDSGARGFDFSASDYSQKPLAQQSSSQIGMLPSSFPIYGFQGSSKKIEIPNGRVGVIIGKSGETIKYLQLQSGAKIQVTRDMDHDPNSQTRPVELVGTPEQISKAEQLISDVIAEAEIGGSGIITSRKFTATQAGAEQFIMKVPNNKAGLIIGKGGETIKGMQAKSGARIQLIPLHPPPGDTSTERTVQIDGTQEQIELAKQLVNEVISENRARNPQMGGGYSQQGYRPPRPPTNWGPPGAPQVQQSGYGYVQSGAYPGSQPPYNMTQPPYGSLPPPPASGGFTSGWDQSFNPATQQTTPGSGYDYYNQQQPIGGSSVPTDNTSYNYGQTPANNSQGSHGDSSTYPQSTTGQQQGYGQDVYSGGYQAPPHQPGYPQPTSNTQTAYDQQGYGTTQPAYGAMANPGQDGSAPTYGTQGGPPQVPPAQQAPPVPSATQQGYATQQPTAAASYASQGNAPTGYGLPPTSQPGYGSQAPAKSGYAQPAPSTQPNYGQSPQGQKPSPTAIYGLTQQLPTTQSAYVQPAPGQAGYSHGQPSPIQSAYGQDSTQCRPPGFAPGGPQATYGQQSYSGVPLQGQQGYGQQQQQPYGDPYGNAGYSQPSDTNGDAAATQSVSSRVVKASPQS